MSDEPYCKICKHSHRVHRYADPIICTACPDRRCQPHPRQSAAMIGDECPACGIPYEELPMGHELAMPLDGSGPTCQILPPPDPGIIDEWLGRD